METPNGRDGGHPEAVGPALRSPHWLAFIAAALIVGVIIATCFLVASLWRDDAADHTRQLENLAMTLSEQTARAFQSVGLIQDDLIARIREQGIETQAQLQEALSKESIYLVLREKISGLPFVDAITAIDETGRLLNFSRYWPIPGSTSPIATTSRRCRACRDPTSSSASRSPTAAPAQ